MQSKRVSFLINAVFLTVCILLYYLGARYLLPVFTPFLFAFAIAFMLQRPIHFLADRTILKSYRTWSVIMVTAVLLTIGVLIFIIGQELLQQIVSLLNGVPSFIDENYPEIAGKLDKTLRSMPFGMPTDLEALTDSILNDTDIPKKLTDWAVATTSAIASSLPILLTGFVVTIVATYFICIDFKRMVNFIKMQFPRKWREFLNNGRSFTTGTMGKLVRSYMLIMLITFLQLAASFILGGWIIGGFEDGIAIAALISLVDFLPVLGSGVILVPWMVVDMMLGNWPRGIWLLVTFIIIIVSREVLEPKIVGKNVGLHPIVALLSMYIGLQLLGVLGMFILPFTLILLIKLQDEGYIRIWREISKPGTR